MLLSGGVDSTTTLALARAEGLVCHTLTFHYGQRHSVEVEAAERIAKSLGVASHTQCRIDLRAIGGSSLTGDIAVPKDRALPQINTGIPVTYVPARNTIFLAYALAVAEVTNSRQIFIGVNAIDYSGYPDCRPEFIAAFENLANLATKAAVEGSACRIRAPFLHHSKAEILRAGLDLGVDYSLTHSCYDPVPADGYPLGVRPCGRCDSCCLRRQAFQALGIPDPAC